MRRWYVGWRRTAAGARSSWKCRTPGRCGLTVSAWSSRRSNPKPRANSSRSTRSLCRPSAPRGPIGWSADVPLVIPGVNLDHLRIVDEQRRRRGWKGYIATLPNCTATGLAITLKALDQRFGVESVIVTTMQGISGAGPRPARARYRREHHPLYPARGRAGDDRDAQDSRPRHRRRCRRIADLRSVRPARARRCSLAIPKR